MAIINIFQLCFRKLLKSKPIPANVPTTVIIAIEEIFPVCSTTVEEIGEIGQEINKPNNTTYTIAGIFNGISLPRQMPIKAIPARISTPGIDSVIAI